MNLREILKNLRSSDELPNLEAKTASDLGKSILETVCAFANEPGLNGGYIALGIKKDQATLFPEYVLEGVPDSDKLQSDLASQCATYFNFPIRPEFNIETYDNKTAVIVHIKELPKHQKPLFIKSKGLPSGAFRRIGATDHKCTEDDLRIFFSDQHPYDQSIIDNTSLDDIDEAALKRYRTLREKLNPLAEELTYDDYELLSAIGCMALDDSKRLTIAGLLLFGKSSTLRRVFPMIRVDYIRVPGNQWVQDPDERFNTIDMRGPLILLVYRLVDAIYADLPKGFKLEENNIQAETIGLPVKVIREAIINALMHRSYRVNSPTQIIRYDNRIEIVNPGFSLKSDDRLGEPGSETRNAHIAAVFHETNLAETKGSGIRAMRRLLKRVKLAPPTFESDRENDRFTVRLLLHHFLSEEDLEWLLGFEEMQLTDSQKQALIFVRELGGIDNTIYRQISDFDTLKASSELRALRDKGLIVQKGKGKYTYYLASESIKNFDLEDDHIFDDDESENILPVGSHNSEEDNINIEARELNTEDIGLTTEDIDLTTEGIDLTTEDKDLTTEDNGKITEDKALRSDDKELTTEEEKERKRLLEEIGIDLKEKVVGLGLRENDKSKIESIIIEICSNRFYKLKEISLLLRKSENNISRNYISKLIKDGRLTYKYPNEITHKEQAYKAIK
jgi:ATP-dependent DNA helicase RecG